MFTFISSTYGGAGNRGIFSGGLYRCERDDGFTTVMKRIYPPPACCTIERYPSGDNYGNKQYLVGGHTANLVIDSQFRCSRQGMKPPNVLPVATVGGGAEDQLLYTRFYDEHTDERSPLSDPLPLTGNVTRAWTSLPTEVPNEQIIVEGTATFAAGTVTGVKTNFGDMRPGDRIAVSGALTRWAQIRSITSNSVMVIDDTGMAGAGVALVCKPVSRATHIELWVAVNGDLPRFTNVRLRIGTLAYTESTATLALGEAEVVSFDAMPLGELNVFYNDRQLIAGVEGHRDTVYLSAIGFPERNEGLAFVTAYNEPIVGMFRFRDYVVLLCPDSSYRLQGYTEDDYARTVLEPHIGGLGHHGNRVGEGAAFVPSRKGIQIFNGAFHQGIPTRREEWQNLYAQNERAWESGLGAINPNDETYNFMPYAPALDANTYASNQFNITPFIWVGSYNTIGAQGDGSISTPEWSSDTYYLPVTAAFPTAASMYSTYIAYLTPSGQKVGRMYRGDNNGQIYRDYFTESETSPGFEGNATVVSAHFLFGDPGGNRDEGKTMVRMWSYLVSEGSAFTFKIWPGDEFCYPPDIFTRWKQINFSGDQTKTHTFNQSGYQDIQNASGLTDGAYTYSIDLAAYTTRWGKQTVHPHQVDGKPVSGRGFTFEWIFNSPNNVTFMGFGGFWQPGPATRPIWIMDKNE